MMRQYGGVVAAPPFTGNLHKYIIMYLGKLTAITCKNTEQNTGNKM